MFADVNWARYLPLLIVAVVLGLRLRALSKPCPVRIGRLWIVPLVVIVFAGYLMARMPVSGAGFAGLAIGAVLGGAVGWQRTRLMKLHLEPAQGPNGGPGVTMRQSPGAILLIVALIAVRRLFVADVTAAGGLGTLVVIDAMLGFLVGLVCAFRFILWRRARALLEAEAQLGAMCEGDGECLQGSA